MWWLLQVALAADPTAGSVVPGAGDVPAGFVEAGVTAGAGIDLWGAPFAAVVARGAGSPVQGVVISGGLSVSGPGAYGVGGGLRALAVNQPGFRLGASVTGGTFFGPTIAHADVFIGAVVLESGRRRRFDLALPLLVVRPSDPQPATLTRLLVTPLIVSELGYTAPIGDRSALRIGKDTGGLALAYRYEAGPIAVEARVSSSLFVQHVSVAITRRWRHGLEQRDAHRDDD